MCDRNIKFVKGGACEMGDGSIKKPYNSLALAQADQTWTTLVVLASPIALDGGIELRSGTELIGEISPLTNSWNRPTITNTSSSFNGGNGVVINFGDVLIKNIHFKDTWSSAINYSNARQLTVCDVLITGHNQGSIVLPFIGNYLGTTITGILAAGIFGSSTRKCKLHLENVHITDNHDGIGLVDNAFSGAHHHVSIKNCEFARLTQSSAPLPEIFDNIGGVFTFSQNLGSESKLEIKNSTFKDFIQQESFETLQTYGVRCDALDFGKSWAKVNKSGFIHLNNLEPSYSASVFSYGENSENNFELLNNHIEEERLFDREGFGARLYNSKSNFTIKNNYIKSYLSLITILSGINNNYMDISDNQFIGSTNIQLGTEGPFFDEQSLIEQTILFNNNNLSINANLGSLTIIPNFYGEADNYPWTTLIISGTNNCLVGPGSDGEGAALFVFNGDVGDNVVVELHNSNIVDFYYDYLINQNQGIFNLQNNWWGQNTGPDNVFNSGAALVTVEPYLFFPIVCPESILCAEPLVVVPSVVKSLNAKHDVKSFVEANKLIKQSISGKH